MLPVHRPALLAAALASTLAGCASLAPRPGADDINALLAERGGPVVAWSDGDRAPGETQAIEAWLASPMTLEHAVRVAMLRSPRLRQEYARLGLARADVLEAVQVGNPRLEWSYERLSPGDGGQRVLGLAMPLADLLVFPVRARLANAEYERAKLEIADAVLGVASDVEAAWYTVVAARQVARMREAVAEAAATSAELAQRFHDAGNISELQLMQERAAASEARIDAAYARADLARARLALDALLGLRGAEAEWQTSERLPLPVPDEDDVDALVALARDSNLELQAARKEAEVVADALGVTRSLRWLGGSGIGYARETEPDGSRLQGPSLSLELPIFNQGQARLARAEARLDDALARVDLAELQAESGVRRHAQEVRTMREVVEIHRTALVPQRETVVARRQQEHNYMLIGAFELIQAKAREYDAYQGYLEAVRDYWLARVGLARAVGQRLPSDAGIAARAPAVDDILAPPAPPASHGMHEMHDMDGMEPTPTESAPADEAAPAATGHHDHHGGTP